MNRRVMKFLAVLPAMGDPNEWSLKIHLDDDRQTFSNSIIRDQQKT